MDLLLVTYFDAMHVGVSVGQVFSLNNFSTKMASASERERGKQNSWTVVSVAMHCL